MNYTCLKHTHTHKMLLPIILIFLIHPNPAASQNFSFPSFDSASCNNGGRLICWGSVTAANGSLNITPDEPGESSEVGRVLFRQPIPVWPASFSTTFTIRITSNSSFSGDGMAFIIAQDDKASPPDSYGSFIGIMDPSTEGGTLRQVAVEFDTYKNPRDIDNNHIAIDTTTVYHPLAARSLTDIGINLKSGRAIAIRIDYDGWDHTLRISAAYAGETMALFLNQKLIMQDAVRRLSYVGFSGSTGHVWELHQILDWNFTLHPLPNTTLHRRGICREKCKWLLAVLVPALGILLVCVALTTVRGQRGRKAGRDVDMETLTKNAVNAPKFFSYKELAKATGDFSKENLVGIGGFGSVYKGVLSDSEFSSTIAVKKINATSKQGEKEYLAEICTIGRLRHKNLVQLQGWCHEKDQLLLVYEYMSNGSLDKYIGKENLDWNTRYKILSGLASVLLYLHEECETPIVHRDVKPNNVMLDCEYSPRLGDFGLARLLENNAFVTTMVAGTIGYLAPEVSYTGRATPESDVYSFGMVVLEVVCGRRSKGFMEEFSLVDRVWNSYESSVLLTCVDRQLESVFDEEEVRRCLVVGLACLHPDQVHRPKMRKVVQVFMSRDEPLMKLPQSRPTEICLSLPSSSPSTTTTELGSSRTRGLGGDSAEEMTIQYDGCYTR